MKLYIMGLRSEYEDMLYKGYIGAIYVKEQPTLTTPLSLLRKVVACFPGPEKLKPVLFCTFEACGLQTPSKRSSFLEKLSRDPRNSSTNLRTSCGEEPGLPLEHLPKLVLILFSVG